MRTIVYTAEIDDRFGAGKVSSRIGLSSPARLYNPQTSLFNDIAAEHKLKPIHCVLVDESQFLTREQVHELSEVVDTLDIPVLCYGLRTDFRGELFTGSQYLLAWSDKLVELKTICFCGRKASMVLRLDQEGRPYNEGEQVVIGGNERYVSVCRKHYKEALSVGFFNPGTKPALFLLSCSEAHTGACGRLFYTLEGWSSGLADKQA